MPLAPNTGPGWSIVTSPNTAGTPTGIFQSVTCASASDCWAVGYYNSDSVQTLIEHWNGTSWAIVASPNTSATVTNYLTAVTCASATDCWAVGYYYTGPVNSSSSQTLTEHWDGTSWAIVASPNRAAQVNQLNGVTCASASECWAIGYSYDGSVYQTLIEHWDGSSWVVVTSPNTTAQYNFLQAVTCASATQCWAVGYYYNGSVYQTLIEQWNGTSWAIVASPNTSTAQNNFLYGVTCASASECWAVGYYNAGSASVPLYQTLIFKWDGTSWGSAPVTSPNNGTQYNFLNSVTCASASQCWAVGYYFNGSFSYQTLIEQWNGTSWSIVASPNTSTAEDNSLNGVTCTSASQCWAVGVSQGSHLGRTLTAQWNGTSWTIVASPNPATPHNPLYGVTCASASDCWAVGYYTNNGGYVQTLIEHWDGTSWAIVASPNTSTAQDNYLNGVTCTSASQCWAVGYYYNSSNILQTLIEQWDGTSWSILTSPNTSTARSNLLNSVTCTSTSQCWAVGYYYNGSNILQTLIERWDGTSWTIVTSPNTSATQPNQLNGVTCILATDCWAVGYYNNGSGFSQTLTEHWNGTHWAIAPSPNTSATQPNQLNGVTCDSASDCWAVGYYYSDFGLIPQTLIEQWDGGSWSILTSPNTSATQPNQLNGVTCPSASECWAVGYYYDYFNAGPYQTLIEQWDGTSWSILTSPNTSATQPNQLNGVTCASASDCWAVGSYGSAHTLIEEYALTIPPLISVGSRMTHGSITPPFDINLPLIGTPGVECRSSASLGAGNYAVVFTFVNNVTNCGTAGTTGGTISSGPSTNQCTENLTGVPNAQYTTVTLNSVLDAQNNTGNVSVTMGVLLGDVDASKRVDSNDVFQVRQQSLQPLPPIGTADFRRDIDASGRIDSNDVFVARQQSFTGLP